MDGEEEHRQLSLEKRNGRGTCGRRTYTKRRVAAQGSSAGRPVLEGDVTQHLRM